MKFKKMKKEKVLSCFDFDKNNTIYVGNIIYGDMCIVFYNEEFNEQRHNNDFKNTDRFECLPIKHIENIFKNNIKRKIEEDQQRINKNIETEIENNKIRARLV